MTAYDGPTEPLDHPRPDLRGGVMGDDVRARLGEGERDDLCDAVMGYTHTRPTAAPERFDRYIVPAVERILAARAADGLRVALEGWIDDQRQLLPDARTPVAHGKAELLRDLRAFLAAHPAPGGGA